jgi:DNA repair protein RecO (recombination protein O)
MEIKTDALMLRSIDYKENDQILTLFSLEKGKMTASVRGVKKAGAKLKFAAQPFCFAEYILAEKSDRHTVIQASLIDSFYDLRNNLVKFYSAFVITELCDVLLYEGSPSPQLFIIALNSLKELCYQKGSDRAVMIKFLIESLSIAGYKMNFRNCGVCEEKKDGEKFFDFEGGCIVCADCKTISNKKISENTYTVITAILNDSYNEQVYNIDGEIRALKLLYVYIYEKTGTELKSLLDLTAILS